MLSQLYSFLTPQPLKLIVTNSIFTRSCQLLLKKKKNRNRESISLLALINKYPFLSIKKKTLSNNKKKKRKESASSFLTRKGYIRPTCALAKKSRALTDNYLIHSIFCLLHPKFSNIPFLSFFYVDTFTQPQ